MDPNRLFSTPPNENDPFSTNASIQTASTQMEHQQRYNPEDGCLYSVYKKVECEPDKGCHQQMDHFRQCPNQPLEKLEMIDHEDAVWKPTQEKPPTIPGVAFNISFNPMRLFQNLQQSTWDFLGRERPTDLLTPSTSPPPSITSSTHNIPTNNVPSAPPTLFGELISTLQVMDQEMTQMMQSMDRSFQFQYPQPNGTPNKDILIDKDEDKKPDENKK